MFLLVTVRHVGAHQDELQHGVSIQSLINLGKTFPRISRIRIIPSTQILARVFVYLPPFTSQILDFICRMVLISILIYFEWRDTENQQSVYQLCSALLNNSNKWTCKASAPSNWRQKRRDRNACMLSCSIYFFSLFSINYIPHNYVITQAMPHAIPQTHSAFYPHRKTVRIFAYSCTHEQSNQAEFRCYIVLC